MPERKHTPFNLRNLVLLPFAITFIIFFSQPGHKPTSTIIPSVDSALEDVIVPYVTTINAVPTNHRALSNSETPNFFEIISSKECLPHSFKKCVKCMRSPEAGNCNSCHKQCGCFCDNLCQTQVQNKVVSKVIEYEAPLLYKRDNDENPHAEKLIPRIVHQTWFEPLEKEK